MAILYNDQAVLENHHAACTFRTMYSDDSCNIMANVPAAERRAMRAVICQAILATDIAGMCIGRLCRCSVCVCVRVCLYAPHDRRS